MLKVAVCRMEMEQDEDAKKMVDNILAGLEERSDFHAVQLQLRVSEIR
jgi:hypothetical protein